ncbi:hypothetical protein D9757_004727 [Collybiopsis confluens]|uniref:TatD DNase family Scn1 n=1 Tax=Collybiopsis confluens TaxID=2823264 RepID=A0A8H5MC41_9AGAR|nr:hypothetical protein D9757_004727 [Collybiopsis confluens]
MNLPSPAVLAQLTDVHAHPTDSPIDPQAMQELQITVCAMSSRSSDQSLVRKLAQSYPHKVVPCFGYHPWFSHCICLRNNTTKNDHYRQLFSPSDSAEHLDAFNTLLSTLPVPIPLDDIISSLRQDLQSFPNAMLGEVGLDRAFRIPYNYDESPRKLSPFTVPLQHQLAILRAQIDLAIELGRNISLHSVKAAQPTMELFNDIQAQYGTGWHKISLDLHSCGFSPEMFKDVQRRYPNTFLSLSTVINGRSPNHLSLIQLCDPHRILVESDYNDINMCTSQTWEMVQTVAQVKGWTVETDWDEGQEPSEFGVVRRLKDNWLRFLHKL